MKVVLVGVLLILCAGVHEARVLNVPAAYPTIQAAIDAAHTSDTVLVAEGTYKENIRFNGKGIMVASRFFITKDWQTVFSTVIDGSAPANKDTASTVMFLNKEDSTSVLDGFTITAGRGTRYLFPYGTGSTKYQEGGGIILHYSSAIIRNNYIIGNTIVPQSSGVAAGGGGGIATMYGNPLIDHNIIASNSAGYAGGIVLNWSGGRVRNNLIIHNTGGAPYGTGGIMVWQAPHNSAFVENNTIVCNMSQADAGGICINLADASSVPVVRNNIVWANKQKSGGQITGPQYGTFNDVEDYALGTNVSVWPMLQDGTLVPNAGSPCIDAGDPDAACADVEDSTHAGAARAPSQGTLRNDLGAYGGIGARVFPSVTIRDLYAPKAVASVQCQAGTSAPVSFAVQNMGTVKFAIDSIVQTDNVHFSVAKNMAGRAIAILSSDSVIVQFKPVAVGTWSDTLRVYYNALGASGPLVLVVTGTANGSTGTAHESAPVDHTFRLDQNFPNPFNPATVIAYHLPSYTYVSLKIFDAMGRDVATLVSGECAAGQHTCEWNGAAYPSGVYFYRLHAGTFTETKRFILVR